METVLEVPAAITDAALTRTLTILHDDLRRKFALPRPRILVLGLNPHAGEGGHLGREELDVIIPTLARLRDQGLQLTGPVPADTAFQPDLLAQHDAVLAMYHDQGHVAVKVHDWASSATMNLGLPFLRTSVDHGTAFDIAGQGIANPIGTILSMAMMLRYSFGLEEEASAVETSVDGLLAEGYRTPDIGADGGEVIDTVRMGSVIAGSV